MTRTAPAPHLPPDPVAPSGGPALSGLAGVLAGAMAMVFVGGSVVVSARLPGALLFTAQAVRYAAACLLLIAAARVTGQRLVLPRGAEWVWLLGVAVTGLVVFNVALVEGSRHAEPAVLGIAVACVPLVLAVLTPVLDRTRPHSMVLTAAVVVTCGAALVQGAGHSDPTGLAWAAVILGCEAGFTLFATPVLRRHGPWGVSVHATWLAAILFTGIGLCREGPSAGLRLTAQDMYAVAYLAVAVTAVAFVLWYSSVRRLGAAVAGLLTGVAPAAAAIVGIALGGPTPGPLVWLGMAVVAGGLALGLPAGRRPGPPTRPRPKRIGA